jgi:hypothetical protein
MGKFANEMIESLKQAAAHMSGRKVRGLRITTVAAPDVTLARSHYARASSPLPGEWKAERIRKGKRVD